MTIIDKNKDEQTRTVPREQSLRQVLEIVAKSTKAKRSSLPESTFERRWSAIQRWLMEQAIPPGIVMSITALLALWFKSRPLLDTMLVLAIICELLAIGMMCSSIVGGTPFLWRLRKAPYAPFLTLVELSTEKDLPIIDELSRCSKEAIQYVLVQYKLERNAFERRTGMLAGTIDKVGIFPALAGLVITVSNLVKASDSTGWGSFFGPLLLILYVQALSAVQMTQKMDKVIALLDFSIQMRK